MIRWLNDRVHRQEDGYALVVATILLFVMMILIVVGLDAGYSALNQSQRGIEWSRTLAVAESGVNDAMVRSAPIARRRRPVRRRARPSARTTTASTRCRGPV